MYNHVYILKRLLGFDFQGLKKGFKEGSSIFGRMRVTGNRNYKGSTTHVFNALHLVTGQ